MNKYKVKYSYSGVGEVIIEANSIIEAENNFFNGENWGVDKTEDKSHEIESVRKLKKKE